MLSKISFLFIAFVLCTANAFAVNPVINGQTIFSDAAPTVTNCGVSPTIATGGTSNGATITVGASKLDAYGRTVPVSQCTLTFATAFTNPASVAMTTYGNGFVTRVASLSTTVMVVYFSSDAAGGKFSFIAF